VVAASGVKVQTGTFRHRGQRLAYTIFGEGRRWVVLTPGLLLPATMDEPLARFLAERGERVVTLDPLGHGRSDRPRDMRKYSIAGFAADVVALLDHLDVDDAVVGGTSLGANITLEVAAIAPRRVRGMIIEMPVLENGLVVSAITFGPILVALHFFESQIAWVSRAARLIPRRLVPFWGNIALDVVRQEPGPSGSLLQGLFFGHVAPHRDLRKTFTAPTLIIGHRRDPVHPFSDAGMLADELPNARLVEASNILELRFRPERLSQEIADFVHECWTPRVQRHPRPRRRTA